MERTWGPRGGATPGGGPLRFLCPSTGLIDTLGTDAGCAPAIPIIGPDPH